MDRTQASLADSTRCVHCFEASPMFATQGTVRISWITHRVGINKAGLVRPAWHDLYSAIALR